MVNIINLLQQCTEVALLRLSVAPVFFHLCLLLPFVRSRSSPSIGFLFGFFFCV